MKSVFKGFMIAMAMYSKIPMPKTEWKQENMKYSICFFPVVGVVCGVLLYAWSIVCAVCDFGQVCFALVGAVLPILVTGGIHVDGFMDTADALHSYAEKEKKLEILKDPHIGAFSVIALVCYFLLCVAGLTQVSQTEQVELLAVSFVLSRTLSGLSLVWFPGAKKDGLLYSFASTAHRRIVRVVLGVLFVLCVLLAVWIQPVTGSVMALVAVGVWVYYYVMSKRQFGGITGDLAGYFLCLCELSSVLVVGLMG